MEPTFNLIDDAWIPCLELAGERRLLSVRQVLGEAETLRDVSADSPLQTAAIYRLLLTLLTATFEPINLDSWPDLWHADRFDPVTLNNYLDQWQDRFELFGAERFMQIEDERVNRKSAVNLKHGFGFLHNPLFDHTNEESGIAYTFPQIASVLLAVQAFGFGGLSGIKQKHTDAPWAKGALFFVQGDTLMQTLVLNLIQYPSERAGLVDEPHYDQPTWEMDEPLEEETVSGYLHYMSWYNRQIWLYPNHDTVTEAKVGPALRLGSGTLDPYKQYRLNKSNGYNAYQFDQDKQLWRNSDTFLALSATGTERATRPPLNILWLKQLAREYAWLKPHTFRLKALGIAKNRGKALFPSEQSFPLPVAYLHDETLLGELKDTLQRTRSTQSALMKALRVAGMALYLNDPSKYKWTNVGINAKSKTAEELGQRKYQATRTDIENWVTKSGAEMNFWAALDAPFAEFIAELASVSDRAAHKRAWFKGVRKSAETALNHALQFNQPTARDFRALAEAKGRLKHQLNKIFPKEQT